MCFLSSSLAFMPFPQTHSKEKTQLEHKSILSTKLEFHTIDLFVELEQLPHNRCSVCCRFLFFKPNIRFKYEISDNRSYLT